MVLVLIIAIFLLPETVVVEVVHQAVVLLLEPMEVHQALVRQVKVLMALTVGELGIPEVVAVLEVLV